MHILTIMPTSQLNTKAELPRLVAGDRLTVLDGMVDRSKLETYLRSDQFDVAHFGQEGDRGVLDLSDGALDMADLVSMLEPQEHLRLIVLNACNSVAVGIKLHNTFHTPVIAHDAPISDSAAVRFTETLYRSLRSTKFDIAKSFQRAVETLDRLFPADARTPQLINGDMADKQCLIELRSEIREAFERIDARMNSLEGKVSELTDSRHWRLQVMVAALLGILVIAQVLTPVLNAMLIHVGP